MFNSTCITHWGLAFALFVSASSVLSTAAQNAPVYIDDSPAAADQIIEATRLRSQNRLTESATKYQHILETYRHKLIKTDKPYHTDTRRLIVSRLLADEPLLTIYRTQYEASAKRLLKQADSASNRQAVLLAVVDRYYLCPSALQAGLDAVGLLLEKADFLAAHALLEQLAPHPDHKQHLTRYHALMSACLLLQNNLKHPLDPQALKTMGLSTARLAPPITLPWSSIYKSGWAIPNLPANITELWNIPLNNPFSSEDANTRRHRFRRQAGQNPPQSPLDGNLIPVIQADLLFVNHQQGINAYDRLSGRPLWEYSLTQQQPTNNSMMSGSILDKNRSVCLTENRVLGVVGFMSQWRSAWKLKNHQTHLVCLDMHTGKQLWKTQPPALDESLQEVFFHGTPLADDRRVYVLMRRSQNSGFHTAYLAALNITDGTLIWKRHLASAAMSNHNPFYALGEMTLKQGQIYVTDNLGTLSAIDGLTGDMLWMYMLDRNQESQTIQPKSRITQRTRSTITARRPAPIVTSKQVLIAPAWANEPALLLDRLTGNPVRKLDTKGFDPTCQLAMTPAGLLSISQTVRLFDSQTFTQKWEQKLNNLNPEQHTQFLVHDKQVLVQTNNQLVTLNLEDGNILNRHPFNQQGIILTANKQWIISRGNELISLMHWDDAYAQLSNRIHRHPNEVWPGLALSHIASMRKQWATVLQGIDAAIDTIPFQNFASPASSVQQHKIQQIFNYIREHVELPAQGDKDPHFAQAQLQSMPDPSTMQALFERLAVVSITPVNEVAQQFARGRYWQYLGKGARAIEHYQSVLEDPTLLGQLYQFDQGARQARLEARLRLVGIITADPQAMIHFEAVATEHLHQLQRTNTTTAQNYLALAESYPLTQAAATARMTAAKQYWQQGQIELAVTRLQQAYPRANTLELKQKLAGKLAQGYQQLNNPAKAHRVLNTFALLFPNQPVWRNNQWVSVDPWISELALLDPTQSGSPKFNLPLGPAIGLEGRLLLPTLHAPNVHSRQLVLLHDNSLFLYQLNQQRMLWSFPLEDPQTQLLAQSTNQLLLWQPTLGQLQSINTHTGQPLWTPIKLNQQIQEVAVHPDRLAREPDVQRQWMQMM
ncbi:MAG: PQQ-binding-like beta-propeller repeat protein, partial [Phycisphaeraceae bacterium]|nr:PQQ-binding-like beta-propeller repeat protein [Phycisphaeraceae bacterium]